MNKKQWTLLTIIAIFACLVWSGLGVLLVSTPSFTPYGSNGAAAEETNIPAIGGSEVVGAGIPVETFSISSSHQTAPEDILKEVMSYFGQGGPGDEGCWGNDESSPAPTSSQTRYLELGDSARVSMCGWQADELVDITIWFPDGRTTNGKARAGSDGGITYNFDTEPSDPPGLYHLLFEGKSRKVEDFIHFMKPPEGAGFDHLIGENHPCLFLYNFAPNERVRIFVYIYDPKGGLDLILVAWQEYHVGFNGQLIVQLVGHLT